MRESSCFRDFIKYSSLNVLGMIALSCYILADTFFVSKALGANGLTALNLAIPVYNFINGSGLMIGMGGGNQIFYFQKSGKDERGRPGIHPRCSPHSRTCRVLFPSGTFCVCADRPSSWSG